MQNNNNNNDNLFTQMFGLETEEQPIEPKKEEPPKIEEPSPQATPIPEPIEQPSEDSLPKVETKIISSPQPQQSDLNSLNFSNDSSNDEVINLSSTSTFAPSQKIDEVVEISSTPEERPKYNTDINDIEDFVPFEETDIKNGASALGKVFLILIVVLALFGGWYFVYNKVLSPSTSKEETPTETETPVVEESTPEQNQTEIVENPITFDETLSFDLGLTSNPDELYQTTGYTTSKKTGVIKCSSDEPITQTYFTQDFDMYLYYEDYQLKKTLQVSQEYYNTKDNYELGLLASKIYTESWDSSDGVNYKYIQNDSTRTIETTLLLNLAYGNYFPTSNSNYYIKSEYTYKENIKTSINKTLNFEQYKDKITCSTVET